MRANRNNRRLRVWRKLTGIATATALAFSVLGGGIATAATPDWNAGYGTDSRAVIQPSSGASSSAVKAGNRVGFFEWLRNGGTSNVSQLYLQATATPAATVYRASWSIEDGSGTVVRNGVCPSDTPLKCSFGALNAGHTVYLVVAYNTGIAVDGTTQYVDFDWSTNGATTRDGGTSRGDSLSHRDSVILTNSGDANGNFYFEQTNITVQTNQKLSGTNQQATTATVTASLTGVAVGDSPSLATLCNSTLTTGFPSWFTCSGLSSLTSVIEVGNGKTFTNGNGGPGIKVIVTFQQAPRQLSSALPFVYHYFTDSNGVGQADLITAQCVYDGGFPKGDTPSEGCLTVNGKTVTVWLFHNGPMRM